MAAPAAGGPARAGAPPVLAFADKLPVAAEEAALKAAVVGEFEFIEVLGNGCNGIAVEARHLNPANPYCKSKVCVVYTHIRIGVNILPILVSAVIALVIAYA